MNSMVIFHSYVKLPEGTLFSAPSRPFKTKVIRNGANHESPDGHLAPLKES